VSGFIREQLTFEVRPRGAPQGTVRRRKVGRPKTECRCTKDKVRLKSMFEFE
jgi:hypothetical protein